MTRVAASLTLGALAAVLVLGAGGCKKNGTDAGGTDAGGPVDSGPGTDAAGTDAVAGACTPIMGQVPCAASPEGYGTLLGFMVTASGGAESLGIDQIALQTDIGGAILTMPALVPDPAAGALTFPYTPMVLFDL